MNLRGIIKSYPIAVSAGTVTLVFLAANYFRSSVVADLKDSLPAKEAEANRLAGNILNAQKLDTQLEQLTALNKQVESRLTDPADVATNQQYFYKIEADTGVKLTDVRPGAIQGRKKQPGHTYAPVPFSLTAQGDYNRIIAFLRRVESGPRICRVNTLNMVSSGRPESGGVFVTLSLNVEMLGFE